MSHQIVMSGKKATTSKSAPANTDAAVLNKLSSKKNSISSTDNNDNRTKSKKKVWYHFQNLYVRHTL